MVAMSTKDPYPLFCSVFIESKIGSVHLDPVSWENAADF